ncbi:MAG: EamA family transporter RarD [Rhodobacteraceae bacterium]|nr:EamA family transporter RarD [Paracoccaceae bacterium]
MSERARGFAALLAAGTIWGFAPLFFRMLNHVPPVELLAHRTVWALALFGVFALLRGRVAAVAGLLAGPGLARVLAAGVLLAVNWLLYILAVQWGEVRQSSLGYYIYPLVSVALGVAVLGERLDRRQGAAVALAALAVGLLSWQAGEVPWIALALAATFGAYGLIKKTLAAGALVSVTAESLWLAPFALLWLAAVHAGPPGGAGTGGQFGQDAATSLLLALSGVVTAAPLMLFTYAARRLSMAAVGLTQYLNPTLQFLVAVLILDEPFGPVQGAAFALIWAALALYSAAALDAGRAARSAAASASTSGTTPL